jgi:hypothetical protein
MPCIGGFVVEFVGVDEFDDGIGEGIDEFVGIDEFDGMDELVEEVVMDEFEFDGMDELEVSRGVGMTDPVAVAEDTVIEADEEGSDCSDYYEIVFESVNLNRCRVRN